MANDSYVRQAGAIPLRNGRLCLVTSRNRRRWVIPKGLIDPGNTAGAAALQEAWEEAGLAGTLDAEPVGSYLYDKCGGTCHVTVFVMHVTAVAQEWPEREYRQRIWVSPAGAIRRIDDPGLIEILRAVGASEAALSGT
ncbi:MAG: NUDIX hydrolase [Gemmataceae bacterium]|nr:NUDIX hydrolase [Gemmataceae bacterium]